MTCLATGAKSNCIFNFERIVHVHPEMNNQNVSIILLNQTCDSKSQSICVINISHHAPNHVGSFSYLLYVFIYYYLFCTVIYLFVLHYNVDNIASNFCFCQSILLQQLFSPMSPNLKI